MGNSDQTMVLLYFMFIIAGLLLAAYGLFSSKKDKNRLRIKRCTQQTTAHITGFDDREYIKKTKRYREYRSYNTITRKKTITYYAPYVEFEDMDGNKIEALYERPLQRRLSNGQKINIRYNPKNPYEFIISGDPSAKIFSSQAILTGLAMIVAGIFLLVKQF